MSDEQIHPFPSSLKPSQGPFHLALLVCLSLAAFCRPCAADAAPAAPNGGKSEQRVTLDASRSFDPDGAEKGGDALSYEWKQISGPAVVLYDSTGPRPYFRADTPGIYVFMVRASDGEDYSAWKKATVEVKAANRPPVAVAGAYRKERVGRYFLLDGRASRDPEGSVLLFQWEQLSGPERLLAPGTGRQPTLRLRASTPGAYIFRLRVHDGALWSDPAEVRIDVLPANKPPELVVADNLEIWLPEPLIINRPPVALARIGNTGTVRTGDWLILDGSASYDLDGQALGYFWYQEAGPFVRELRPLKGMSVVRFRAEEAGEYAFRLVVSDGAAESEPVIVKALVESTNSPPVVTVAGDLSAAPGTAEAGLSARAGCEVILDATGSRDADGDTLAYRWEQVSGPRITDFFVFRDTAGGKIAFTPGQPGEYVLRVSVADGVNAPVQRPVRVRVVPANRPPEVTAPQQVLITPGKPETVHIRAVDPDGDRVAVSHAVLAGSELSIAHTGDGSVEVRAPRAGTWPVRFFFRDGVGGVTYRDVTFRATDAAGVPVLALECPETAGVYEVIEIAGDLKGAETAVVRWRWQQLAGPLVFLAPSASAGPTCTFVPTAEGRYRLHAVATLGNGEEVAAERSISVAGRAAPPAAGLADLLANDLARRLRAAALLAAAGKDALSLLEQVSLDAASDEVRRDLQALHAFLRRLHVADGGGD